MQVSLQFKFSHCNFNPSSSLHNPCEMDPKCLFAPSLRQFNREEKSNLHFCVPLGNGSFDRVEVFERRPPLLVFCDAEVLQLPACHGIQVCCFPLKQPADRFFKTHRIMNTSRRHACSTQSSFYPKKNFTQVYSDFNFYRREKLSRRVVRSELAGSGSGSAGASSYPLSEIQLVSKIRGICFYAVTAFTATFLFVLMLVEHPFVLLFDRYRRKAHYLVAKIWASLTVAPFIKIEFEGLKNLPPPNTPAVYVSNHQSFLDIYTLLTLGRSFKFISKTAIFLFPIIGWAMFLMGVIPLKRMDSRSQLECLKQCIALVKKGASVFFFPEGTRSKDGKLGAFKKGAFSVAVKTGVPVVPITLIGTGKIMPTGMEGQLNLGTVKVVIHQPIEGDSPDALCSQARDIIADGLFRQG